MKKLIMVAALIAAPISAHAQDLNYGAVEDGTDVATLTAGAEQGFVVGAGYARAISVADRLLVLGGDLELDWAEIDIDDFRMQAGASAPIVTHRRLQLIGSLAGVVRGTNNDAARMINVGVDAAVLGGYYAPRWFVAGEVGFDWAGATHITHSDTYRMVVYADAKDGWYGNTAGTFRYGIQAGLSFAGNDVVLRAGRLMDVAGNPALFPIYATLAYDRRW
ncbi:MAG TPA: hypothetical protein VFV99_07135 [Kofleriaceae bacterium]|nr:hypothetical protein [Kofleriaceae bacterium]